MDETPSPEVPKAAPGNKRAVLLPIAAAAAGLAVFLIAFLPDGEAGKKDRGAREGRSGNSSATERGDRDGGYSPVGGKDRKPVRAQGDSWWYKESDPAAKDSESDAWWYREKSGREREDDAKKPPRGGSGKAAEGNRKAAKSGARADADSGPDLYWWRD